MLKLTALVFLGFVACADDPSAPTPVGLDAKPAPDPNPNPGPACGNPGNGVTACPSMSCAAGNFCQGGFCEPGCTSDANCGRGEVCRRSNGQAVGACEPCQPAPEPVSMFKHGSLCVAPDFNCGGASTGLICITDGPNDTQGVCRLVCPGFSACLNNDDARRRFDTDCCDSGNSTRVCGQRADFPAGACR